MFAPSKFKSAWGRITSRQEQPVRALENEYSAPTSYFDLLPHEVLNHMLRFFSCLPNSERWENSVPLNHIIVLFQIGAFGNVLKNRFNKLCISASIDCHGKNQLLRWKHRREPMLWANDVDLAYDFVLAGGGEYLNTLIVNLEMPREDMVDGFRENCPNLKSLGVLDKNSKWIHRFGEKLEKLDKLECWSSPVQIPTCSNLREITLCVGNHLLLDSSIWERIGGTLEILTLSSDYRVSVEEIGKIEKNCPKLRRICIPVWHEEVNAALSNLLASYGDQLQWAEIFDLNENQLDQVGRSCSNASFHLYSKSSRAMRPSLQILGHKLENITIMNGDDRFNNIEFTDEWSKCIKLRELSIHRCIIENVRPVFSTPKPYLKSIYIEQDMHANGMKEIMEILSEGAFNIEEFTVDFLGDFSYWSMLEKFIESNKSTLLYVALSQAYSNKKVREMIRILLQGSSLKEIRCLGEPSEKLLKTLVTQGVQCRGWFGTIYYTAPLAKSYDGLRIALREFNFEAYL